MPMPDLGTHAEAAMRKMAVAPMVSGWLGWPIPRHSMQYLVGVGYVQVFYDWEDGKTKAELTEKGRQRIEREIASSRMVLCSQA